MYSRRETTKIKCSLKEMSPAPHLSRKIKLLKLIASDPQSTPSVLIAVMKKLIPANLKHLKLRRRFKKGEDTPRRLFPAKKIFVAPSWSWAWIIPGVVKKENFRFFRCLETAVGAAVEYKNAMKWWFWVRFHKSIKACWKSSKWYRQIINKYVKLIYCQRTPVSVSIFYCAWSILYLLSWFGYIVIHKFCSTPKVTQL